MPIFPAAVVLSTITFDTDIRTGEASSLSFPSAYAKQQFVTTVSADNHALVIGVRSFATIACLSLHQL